MTDEFHDIAPAGWYEDPEHNDYIRYFDGKQWTETRQLKSGMAVQQNTGVKREKAWWEILLLVLLFCILGFVALVAIVFVLCLITFRNA